MVPGRKWQCLVRFKMYRCDETVPLEQCRVHLLDQVVARDAHVSLQGGRGEGGCT